MKPSLIQTNYSPDEAACYRCGKYPVEFHHCLTGALRGNAELIGAWVWLCPSCHRWAHDTADGVAYLKELKRRCQESYEAEHTRAEWMHMAHRNYRED